MLYLSAYWIVLIGTACLGIASGVVGSLLLLRKRALLADAAAHATLPGIALGFWVALALGFTGKEIWLILPCAFVTAAIGSYGVQWMQSMRGIRDDAAIALVLAVMYGLGYLLLRVMMQSPTGQQSGLGSYVVGQSASLTQQDSLLLLSVAVVVCTLSAICYRPFRALCFDAAWCQVRGMPTRWVDALLLALILMVICVGLPTVGLLLMTALLIIPASTARYYTQDLRAMQCIAAGAGLFSSVVGTTLSLYHPMLPTGPSIVLVSSACFFVSMLFAPRKGWLSRKVKQWRYRQRIQQEHLLRRLWEWHSGAIEKVSVNALQQHSKMPTKRLKKLLWRCEKQGWLRSVDAHILLTEPGSIQARKLVRNHRLWEAYLLQGTSLNATQVDFSADMVEHILSSELVEQLLQTLPEELRALDILPSPHPLLSEAV